MRYIDPHILEKANRWLTPFFDADTQLRIKELIAYNSEELMDSFYKSLEFGTGGMRGIMGDGDNRVNKYTLGRNTQGIANYLHQKFPEESLKAVIAYDCRHNSQKLAETVAAVFSANGIQVYLYPELRPTPLLSFAVRYYNCHCGIVLTASHNPPEYNGYKVYWRDGGQLVPPQDREIIAAIEQVNYEDILFDAQPERIQLLDSASEIAFAKASITHGRLSLSDQARQNLSVVFTPLHGTAITLVPQVLQQAGYTQVHLVEEQTTPDGNFSTVISPNPEEPEALEKALQLAEKIQADLVIGTDPDSDRLGIAVRNQQGALQLLNGNQTMVLMTAFLLEYHQKNNSLPKNSFIATTLVSTPMMKNIAEYYGVELKESLTGFKWIAKMIQDHPEQNFIGGGEESYGYLVGDFVRDKDAITASLLACEISAYCKSQGLTVPQYLEKLYLRHGYFKEDLVSLTKKGRTGAEQIEKIMYHWRHQPPQEIGGQKTVRIEDYLTATALQTKTGKTESLTLPTSNVLVFYLEDHTKICIRPSGTEPKIKFYISVQQRLENLDLLEEVGKQLDEKIVRIKKDLEL